MARLPKNERILLKKAIDELYGKSGSNRNNQKKYKDVETLWRFFDVPIKKRIRFNDPTETDVCATRLIALQYAVLALALDCGDGKAQYLYSGLFGCISNTIIAIMRLAEDGLDYQAMALIRNLFELYMTLIISMESPEKREAFTSAIEPEEARKVWHHYFTKTRFQKMMSVFCQKHIAFKEAEESYQTWIEENYKDLSSFVHNDYANIVFCWRSQDDSKGCSHPNLWGEYVTWRKRIYHSLFAVAWLSHMLFSCMLVEPSIDIDLKCLLGLYHNDSAKTALNIFLDLQCLILDMGVDSVLNRT